MVNQTLESFIQSKHINVAVLFCFRATDLNFSHLYKLVLCYILTFKKIHSVI